MPMPAQRPAYTSDLSDEEWRILAPLLPPEKPGGRPRKYPHEAAPPTLGGGHRCANGEDYGKGGPHGSDAAKKFNGRKPHLLLDTTGFLLRVLVHPAHLRDAEMAPCHLVAAYETGERLQHIWADMAYRGQRLCTWVQQECGWRSEERRVGKEWRSRVGGVVVR